VQVGHTGTLPELSIRELRADTSGRIGA
jgi:hypothetical protein